MNKQVLKAGSGHLHGLSTYEDQPGKVLILSDGTTTICHLKLDKAFPPQTIFAFKPFGMRLRLRYKSLRRNVLNMIVHRLPFLGEVEETVPGVLLNIQFITNLQTETDGDVLIECWQ